MNEKRTAQRRLFRGHGLFALFICIAAAGSILSGTLLAFFRPEASTKVSERTLTFIQRVAYQRAIEGVYSRHRIWPKERPGSKPPLDAAMSQAQIESKVQDYLRNSQALEDYWQRPITTEQLQGEMDRMAQHTKQPDVLRELFDALGNDPFVIAECLARPALAERLVTNFYAHDERFHGELRQRAQTDLLAHNTVEQMKQTSGTYSEIKLIKQDTVQERKNRGTEKGIKLNSREWAEQIQKLTTMFDNRWTMNPSDSGIYRSVADADAAITTGKLTQLKEDGTRFYVVGVINKAKDRLTLATVVWLKEPFESWVGRAKSQVRSTLAAPTGNYTLPIISTGGCTDNTWTHTTGPIARVNHTAVWTGTEMIIWGGHDGFFPMNTGERYNPTTDTWTATSVVNAPSARSGHSAVWTGTEMIVWGGAAPLNTGGRYNPGADGWTQTNSTNAPTARTAHTALWTGIEMIVWGGQGDFPNLLNTGGRYNPSTDSWIATSTTNAPSARYDHTAIWTGSEMIVWGGGDISNPPHTTNTGARYNPSTDSWISTSTANVPDARLGHTAVWIGGEMIVWGGDTGNFILLDTGGKYNPTTDTWAATSTTNVPTARAGHSAVCTDTEMIVWGGFPQNGGYLNTAGRYDPGTDSWTATSLTNAPSARFAHTAVWTENEMIVWGGMDNDVLNTGGRYDPSSDSWIATTANNIPSARLLHTAVWTGSEMIVWGGIDESFFNTFNTGGRYDPATDTWTPTSTFNPPHERVSHTAVWTGNEMIVWGGVTGLAGSYLNSGGRYNPGTDNWVATSITNAPDPRQLHSAIWGGNEMIVWGGAAANFFNTGGRYNPNTDSWTSTSTANAPSSRWYSHGRVGWQ